MRPTSLAALTLAALLLATPVAAQTSDPAMAAQAFVDAMNSGDWAAAAALFSDDGFIQTPRERRQGPAVLRAWTEEHVGYHIVIARVGNIEVSGDRAVWAATVTRDDWLRLGIPSIDHRYEATVREGKITALAFAFDPEQEARLRAAQAAAREAAAAQPGRAGGPSGLLSITLGLGVLLVGVGVALRRQRSAQHQAHTQPSRET